MKIIDISNKHKKKFVAFIKDSNKQIIVGSATLTALAKYIQKNNIVGDIIVYDKAGNRVSFNPVFIPQYGIQYSLISSLLICMTIIALFLR